METDDRQSFAADVNDAVACMKRGGVIVYPTDTVWGIGCDATDSRAVRRIFEIKRRAEAKALITLVGSMDMLLRYLDNPPQAALELAELATTPVTVIYDHPVRLAPELLAPDGSAGIRLTAELFSSALCRALRRPVVSTSANISGAPTPGCFAEIAPEILDAADYVVRYRRHDRTRAKASSVIKITDDSVMTIIRK